MIFCVQIYLDFQTYCKSGLFGIYFVKLGSIHLIAAKHDRARHVGTNRKLIAWCGDSVLKGSHKDDKNKKLSTYRQNIEIDRKMNSIEIKRRADQRQDYRLAARHARYFTVSETNQGARRFAVLGPEPAQDEADGH